MSSGKYQNNYKTRLGDENDPQRWHNVWGKRAPKSWVKQLSTVVEEREPYAGYHTTEAMGLHATRHQHGLPPELIHKIDKEVLQRLPPRTGSIRWNGLNLPEKSRIVRKGQQIMLYGGANISQHSDIVRRIQYGGFRAPNFTDVVRRQLNTRNDYHPNDMKRRNNEWAAKREKIKR